MEDLESAHVLAAGGGAEAYVGDHPVRVGASRTPIDHTGVVNAGFFNVAFGKAGRDTEDVLWLGVAAVGGVIARPDQRTKTWICPLARSRARSAVGRRLAPGALVAPHTVMAGWMVPVAPAGVAGSPRAAAGYAGQSEHRP